jgi:hypothetical protein
MNHRDRAKDTPASSPGGTERPVVGRRRLPKRGGLVLAAVAAFALAGYAGIGVSSAAENGTATATGTPTPTPTVTTSGPARTTSADGGSTGIVDSA